MRKLLLIAVFLLVATVGHTATFYRVILDLPFDNLTTAVNFMNLIETNKAKVNTTETQEGNEPWAKMVGSWDTEFANYPEYTMITVDFAEASQVYDKADYSSFTQVDIDRQQAYVNSVQTKIDNRQAAIDAAQAELNAE